MKVFTTSDEQVEHIQEIATRGYGIDT